MSQRPFSVDKNLRLKFSESNIMSSELRRRIQRLDDIRHCSIGIEDYATSQQCKVGTTSLKFSVGDDDRGLLSWLQDGIKLLTEALHLQQEVSTPRTYFFEFIVPCPPRVSGLVPRFAL